MIPIIMLLIFLLIIAGLGAFIYSLINNKNSMNENIKTKALDVFVYVGIAISLVWSVVNLLQIVFAAIDRKFVDILNTSRYVDMYSSDVRFAIASLVVMFPLYLGLSWYVSKDIAKFLYKRDLLIRKVVVYLTLFVTVCTLVGTLVTLIYTYLGGEISIRFELKALAVFVLALSLFSYYLYSLRRDYTKKSYIPLVASIVTTLVVLASIVWSVGIIGTPSEMRAKRIDSTRLSDISRIQQEILNRLNMTEKMPADLSELNNAFQGYAVPTDPVTKVAYGYNVTQQPTFKMNYTTNRKELVTSAIFELCATFETVRAVDERGAEINVSMPMKPGIGGGVDMMYSASNYYYDGDMSPFWNHDIGEKCFKRVISSEMYYGR
ncbi:DUF5671 domain-containing protein [Candidatus Gracilibacteria bacterium]|nr:DUF5671 domain-containing protein [Candidatus Gracilibacteria bacterium]